MRLCRLLAGLIACTLLSGCAQSVADAYADFLTDYDILMRFEICFDDASKSRAGEYTKGELRALHNDLASYGYASNDETAASATQFFERSADSFIEALDAPRGSQEERLLLEKARQLFIHGWQTSVAVRRDTAE